MNYKKWLGIFFVILLMASCFFTWMTVPSRSLTVTGVSAEGTNFGKPGFFNLFFGFFFLVFHMIPKLWAKRLNLLVVALNTAWAVRNYFIITACRDGECPQIHAGLYIMEFASLMILISALFPDIELNTTGKKISASD